MDHYDMKYCLGPSICLECSWHTEKCVDFGWVLDCDPQYCITFRFSASTHGSQLCARSSINSKKPRLCCSRPIFVAVLAAFQVGQACGYCMQRELARFTLQRPSQWSPSVWLLHATGTFTLQRPSQGWLSCVWRCWSVSLEH